MDTIDAYEFGWDYEHDRSVFKRIKVEQNSGGYYVCPFCGTVFYKTTLKKERKPVDMEKVEYKGSHIYYCVGCEESIEILDEDVLKILEHNNKKKYIIIINK